MLSSNERGILVRLNYEWWMFRATYALLQRLPLVQDPVRYSLLESLVIHRRGLIYFFYWPKRKESDWKVSDLGHGLKRSVETPELCRWRADANKRVAHLTEQRENPLSEWGALALYGQLATRISDVRRDLGLDLPVGSLDEAQPISTVLLEPTILSAIAQGPVGMTGPAAP